MTPATSKNKLAPQQRSTITWLAFPAALQVATTVAVFIVGRLGLLPSSFDAKGIGISFAADGTRYDKEALELVQILTHNGIGVWLDYRIRQLDERQATWPLKQQDLDEAPRLSHA